MEKQEVIVTLALEGWIEEFFLPEYLRLFEIQFPVNFIRDNLANPSYGKSVGKEKNLSRLLRVAESALQNARIHEKNMLLVFGVDCEWEQAGTTIDSDEGIQIEIQRIKTIFSDSTPGLTHDQKILFIPIRSFDTWIWYLQNPDFPKGHLENMPAQEIKKLVFAETPDFQKYGKISSSRNNSSRIVESLKKKALMNNTALNHLATQSPSFQHFHQQILTYLQKFP